MAAQLTQAQILPKQARADSEPKEARTSPDSPAKPSSPKLPEQEIEEENVETDAEGRTSVPEFEIATGPRSSSQSFSSRRPVVNIRATRVEGRNVVPATQDCFTFVPTPSLRGASRSPSRQMGFEKHEASGKAWVAHPQRPRLLKEFLTQHKQNFYNVPEVKGQVKLSS